MKDMTTMQGYGRKGCRLALALLIAAQLPFGVSALTAAPRQSTDEIRDAYAQRQFALLQLENDRAKQRTDRKVEREHARSLPLLAKAIITGFCLIVLGSIADRRRWLPALLGNDLCQRLGYAFRRRNLEYWPHLRHLAVEKIRPPERIPLLQNVFIDPDKLDNEDADRLVIDLEAVENYSPEDLGLDSGRRVELRRIQCPFPTGRDTFSKAA